MDTNNVFERTLMQLSERWMPCKACAARAREGEKYTAHRQPRMISRGRWTWHGMTIYAYTGNHCNIPSHICLVVATNRDSFHSSSNCEIYQSVFSNIFLVAIPFISGDGIVASIYKQWVSLFPELTCYRGVL